MLEAGLQLTNDAVEELGARHLLLEHLAVPPLSIPQQQLAILDLERPNDEHTPPSPVSRTAHPSWHTGWVHGIERTASQPWTDQPPLHCSASSSSSFSTTTYSSHR